MLALGHGGRGWTDMLVFRDLLPDANTHAPVSHIGHWIAAHDDAFHFSALRTEPPPGLTHAIEHWRGNVATLLEDIRAGEGCAAEPAAVDGVHTDDAATAAIDWAKLIAQIQDHWVV
jgi:hypothetical protein